MSDGFIDVCLIGHGGMGRWHSEALKRRPDCRLRSVVGRRPEPTAAFAREFGYTDWYTDLGTALADPGIDIVIVASPSEDHAAHALAALEAGKHALVEIPVAMGLAGAQKVVAAASNQNRKVSAVFPMRMMPDMLALRARIAAGAERLRLIESRFIIKRWENIGWTGYQRSWTDNLLWHHLGHLVDFQVWLAGKTIATVNGHQSPPDATTGTAMDAHVAITTASGQPLVTIGSYAGHRSVCGTLILTDRDCYEIDALTSTLTTQAGSKAIPDEQADCAAVLFDFLDAVREDREPAVAGASILPAMSALQAIQDGWEALTNVRSTPGRRAGSL